VFTPVGDQPEEFAAYIKSEIEKWGAVVKATGLTAN
jgi:tripartite-type tricarboxylate transporter receptor subunit TctC